MNVLNKNSIRFIAGFLGIVLVTFGIMLVTNTFQEKTLPTFEVREECDTEFC